MNVAQSNRVMSRILAVVGCLVILMLAILLIRGVRQAGHAAGHSPHRATDRGGDRLPPATGQ